MIFLLFVEIIKEHDEELREAADVRRNDDDLEAVDMADIQNNREDDDQLEVRDYDSILISPASPPLLLPPCCLPSDGAETDEVLLNQPS